MRFHSDSSHAGLDPSALPSGARLVFMLISVFSNIVVGDFQKTHRRGVWPRVEHFLADVVSITQVRLERFSWNF